MAKNQRQRRPLQEDKRTDRKTPRERQQVSRRQRDRIEENRDRRELRRERERLRRTTVDSIRSPKEDLRTERTESRLVPIEDTFLGRPIAVPTDLPVLIGERWDLQATQVLTNATLEDVEFATPAFTTERNGYPALYDTSTRLFTIPGGLAGIWKVTLWATVQSLAGSSMSVQAELNNVLCGYAEGSSGTAGTAFTSPVIQCFEGDQIRLRVAQFTGGDADLLGTVGYTGCSLIFLGK